MHAANALQPEALQHRAFKLRAVHGRAYWNRVSTALAIRLDAMFAGEQHVFSVLDEIDFLESRCRTSRTRPEARLTGALAPFWHKQFKTPSQILRNIVERCEQDGLDGAISQAVLDAKGDRDLLQSVLSHRLVADAYHQPSDRGRDPELIIYAKHEGANYYLDLATHAEGRDAAGLLKKLRQGSFRDFPFLFSPSA